MFPLRLLSVGLVAASVASRHIPGLEPSQQYISRLDDSQESVSATPAFTRRIVAVGDLHGDFPNAFKVLQMAHVVDKHGDWTGDVDFFVQTGDIIDR